MEIMSKTGWRIIEELSKGDKSPTEIARIMKISIPAVHMQLAELERKGLIKKIDAVKGKTRPYQQYSIGDGFLFFMKAMPHETEKKFIAADENLKLHLRIWGIPQTEFHFPVEAYLWSLKPSLKNIDAIAVFGSVARGDAKKDSDIDMLILTNRTFDLQSKMVEGRIFMPQVFETRDFEQTLKNGSKFIKEVLKGMVILYDPKEVLKNVKRRTG